MNEALHSPTPKQERTPAERAMYLRRRLGAGALGVAITAGTFLAASATGDYIDRKFVNPVEYSDDTSTYTLESSDGIWRATYEIEGIDKINDKQDVVNYIAQMPENAEVFADDRLDAGETLVIPESVTPR